MPMFIENAGGLTQVPLPGGGRPLRSRSAAREFTGESKLMLYLGRFALLAAATALTAPVVAAPAQSVPISALVREVSIPHTTFQLANGLTVIVHEDHKA